ncbi:hypothetical protein [Neopusillimonas maritima]|uniref:Uncharacterized protein n=1 Tax=Neopusillimonas maritima TaxID=2026239 RepID=A0A3A1YTS6_9BURK|nr:hypothetical protein [Neopusillimonas maritima]RIY41055.1 hypothetical protein CJP73_07865 [Neopusillimonas maritima]
MLERVVGAISYLLLNCLWFCAALIVLGLFCTTLFLTAQELAFSINKNINYYNKSNDLIESKQQSEHKLPLLLDFQSIATEIDWNINDENIASGPGITYENDPYLYMSESLSINTQKNLNDSPVFMSRIVGNMSQANVLVEYLVQLGFSSYQIERSGYEIEVFAGPVNNLEPGSPAIELLLSLGFI